MTHPGIEVSQLSFEYPDSGFGFSRVSFRLPIGSRTLLAGANGVGKSTLLKLLAGRRLVPADSIRILGRSPFFDPGVGGRIAFVDGDFPLNLDIRVEELMEHKGSGVDERRERELCEILEIDPGWRMDRVSEGQRSRVQLYLTLRKPVQVMLLDEVTTHLDIVARARLQHWLKSLSENEGVTLVYATHILDGLWKSHEAPWPTHLLFLDARGVKLCSPVSEIADLRDAITRNEPSPLLSVCEHWMQQ